MNIEQVKQAIEETPKGCNIIVEWTRPCKTLKAVTDEITKAVRMVGRMGIEYDNMKSVKVGRAIGELPETNQGLPAWQEFEIYPYLLRHKNKGTQYLRLYKGTSHLTKHKTTWYKNGVEVSFEDIENLILASEKSSKKGDCFQVTVNHITRLHREDARMNIAEQARIEVEPEAEEIEA
jgi:hypothetical protein